MMNVTTKRKFDLSDRLINFSVSVIELAEQLPRSVAGKYLAHQLTRAAIAPSLHYSEATSAESRKDFIHKMKIGLKELRESMTCLRIIQRKQYTREKDLSALLKESDELISIFVRSIQTAKRNIKKLK